MVTIKEIAEMAGVSTTTVSNVLHKKTARVSANTIEKVEKLLAENNYIPSNFFAFSEKMAAFSSSVSGICSNNATKFF